MPIWMRRPASSSPSTLAAASFLCSNSRRSRRRCAFRFREIAAEQGDKDDSLGDGRSGDIDQEKIFPPEPKTGRPKKGNRQQPRRHLPAGSQTAAQSRSAAAPVQDSAGPPPAMPSPGAAPAGPREYFPAVGNGSRRRASGQPAYRECRRSQRGCREQHDALLKPVRTDAAGEHHPLPKRNVARHAANSGPRHCHRPGLECAAARCQCPRRRAPGVEINPRGPRRQPQQLQFERGARGGRTAGKPAACGGKYRRDQDRQTARRGPGSTIQHRDAAESRVETWQRRRYRRQSAGRVPAAPHPSPPMEGAVLRCR